MNIEAFMQIADKYMDKIIQEYIDSEFIAAEGVPVREPDALKNAKEDFCAAVMDYFKDAKRNALELYPVDKWSLYLGETDIFEDYCIIADAMVTVGRVGGYDILCPLHLQVINRTGEHTADYSFAESKDDTPDLQYRFALAGHSFQESYRQNAMHRAVVESERGQAFSDYVKDNMQTAAVLLRKAFEKEHPVVNTILKNCNNFYYDSNGTGRRLEPADDRITDYAHDLYEARIEEKESHYSFEFEEER